MSRLASALIAAVAFFEAAAAPPRAVLLPAAKFGGAPLQARFDDSGQRVIVETLVRSCEFAFDPLFAHPEGPIVCDPPLASAALRGTFVGSPAGSAVVAIRDGRLAAFRRVDGALREVTLPTLPRVRAVVPMGSRRSVPRFFLTEGRPGLDASGGRVPWRLVEGAAVGNAMTFDLRRPPVVSDDELRAALVQDDAVIVVEGDGAGVLYSLPGHFDDAVLSADGRVAVAWASSIDQAVAIGGRQRPPCNAPLGHGVRLVASSPAGNRILVVGEYTKATLLDGESCSILKTDAFEAKSLNFISAAVVDNKGGITGVILEGVLEGFRTATRLVRFPHSGPPWALELPLPAGAASATRPALAVGREGRFVVHSLKGVALVRGRP